jgi:hypothetical protein
MFYTSSCLGRRIGTSLRLNQDENSYLGVGFLFAVVVVFILGVVFSLGVVVVDKLGLGLVPGVKYIEA